MSMTNEHNAEVPQWAPGDCVYRYVWVGGEAHDVQPLRVVRSNRLTVTCITQHGSTLRVPHADIVGRWGGGERP